MNTVGKWLILIVCTFLSIVGYGQHQFEYKGDYPKDIYTPYRISRNIEHWKEIPYRNRIYLVVDTFFNIYLNGHKIPTGEFEKSFKFIYSNANGLDHLPRRPQDAVLYYCPLPSRWLDFEVDLSKVDPTKLIEAGQIDHRITRVVFEMRETYSLKQFYKPMNALNRDERDQVKKTIPINLYTIKKEDLGKEVNQSNQKLEVKVPDYIKEMYIYPIEERNIIRININDKNEVTLKGEIVEIEELEEKLFMVVNNPDKDKTFPEALGKAICHINYFSRNQYKMYQEVLHARYIVQKMIWKIVREKHKFGNKNGLPVLNNDEMVARYQLFYFN